MTKSTVAVAAIAVMIVLMAVICSAVLFVVTHRDSSAQSVETADREFQQLRARFADQQPLLDMNVRQVRAQAGPSKASAPFHAFHTVIFDTRGGRRIVRMTVPYWLFHRYTRRGGELHWLGELTFFDDTEFDPEPIHLSLSQIEQHGPGLIADYRHPSGGQFFSWVD